ncbi:MAG TPA: hypothetical protein VF174_01905 [Micromonosporaceae bacterium]
MTPITPPAKQRPGSVTIASYLLYLVAALQLLQFAVSLPVIGTIQAVYEDAYAGTEMAEVAGTVGIVGLIVGGVVSLIIAIGLVVLAVLNNQGKNPARIVTWVLGGIAVCCFGLSLVSQAIGGTFTAGLPGEPDMPDPAEVQRMLDERMPGWYAPVNTAIGVVSLIALLVALILLALPASNEFFRKPRPTWEPPVPGSPYPGYPPSNPPAGPSGPQPPAPPPAG